MRVMYWFVVKEMVSYEDEASKEFLYMPDSITYLPDYIQVTYRSLKYTNLDDMLDMLDEVVLYTDQNATVHVYSDNVLYRKCRDEIYNLCL